jgi:beta-mannosidase
MGLMYWQINDIWQAPTWATIDYSLRWKMSHYYVRHMYAPVYPIAILTPYLADTTDETAKISFYIVNDLVDGTQGQLLCSVYNLERFSVRLSFGFDIIMNTSGVRQVSTLPYASVMQRAACNNSHPCLVHCVYNTDGNIQVDQTLFLTRPKHYQFYQPNLQVQVIQQKSPYDYDIALTANRPALFVWLETSGNMTGYFSRNGFNMFEPSITISFHSWTPISHVKADDFHIRHTSLYDVTITS